MYIHVHASIHVVSIRAVVSFFDFFIIPLAYMYMYSLSVFTVCCVGTCTCTCRWSVSCRAGWVVQRQRAGGWQVGCRLLRMLSGRRGRATTETGRPSRECVTCTMYTCEYRCRRKEERSKQGHTNNKAK